jgi:hypothetical protein
MFFTMNKQEHYEEDLLRKFINSERIEKAPVGFTPKTMARIRIEAQEARLKPGFFAKNRIPLISAAIIAGFIVIAVLVPTSNADSVDSVFWQNMQNIKINLPGIGNTIFKDSILPGWMIYALAAFPLLAFLDKALFGFFHKEINP